MIPKIKKILYTTDLSKNSVYAFLYAINSAKKHDASIVILHVKEMTFPTLYSTLIDDSDVKQITKERIDRATERINKRLDIFFDKIKDEDPELAHINVSIDVCDGYPEEEILKKADDYNCDVIVMGAHGKGIITQTFRKHCEKGFEANAKTGFYHTAARARSGTYIS